MRERDADRLDRIQADLREANTVVYLEGKTDPEILFALLGVPQPRRGTHRNVYVVGLQKGPSGGQEVRSLVDVAVRNGLGGDLGRGGVFGIVDGDGRELSTLTLEHDPPYAGPLFSLKGYCIENLLARTAWPNSWGASPDWTMVLERYAPYVALNRLHLRLQGALQTLRLQKFQRPSEPLLDVDGVLRDLERDQGLITNLDVAAEYQTEVAGFKATLRRSVDEAHCLLNGKWLVDHHVRTMLGSGPDSCRTEWMDAARMAGGLPEMKSLWQQISGSLP